MGQTGANAVVKVVDTYGENGDQRRYTVAAGTSISEGALLDLTDPRTAITTANEVATGIAPPAGVAAMDKDGTDGSTSISAYTNCMIEVACCGAIVIGHQVTAIKDNYVAQLGGANQPISTSSLARVLGRAEETGDDDEVINVRVLI